MHGAYFLQQAVPGHAANSTQRRNGIADPQAVFRLMVVLAARKLFGGKVVLVEVTVKPYGARSVLVCAKLGQHAL